MNEIERQTLSPRVYLLAGPNGAGKTTFAREFLTTDAECTTFINADLIAAGVSPFAPERAAMRAGRIMLELIRDSVRRRETFSVETTLSDASYARAIPQWRTAGYEVVLYFLALPSADFAIARVAQRVRQGGHAIPVETIRRRYASGRRLLDTLYKPLVNRWKLYDSSGDHPLLIAEEVNP